jgi:hypothetical protein
MRELRLYVGPTTQPAHDEQAVFYSRRANGPYYRWLYEETRRGWRPSRVSMSKLNLSALCAASWSAIPAALQARLVEHYLE